jgi:ATP-dependent DNA helicase DinG
MAPQLHEGLFTPMEALVCTSATMRTGSDFAWWLRRTGAGLSESSRVTCGVFPSPFPYKTALLFAVPTDAPSPTDSDAFQAYTDEAVCALIQAAQGRTRVLFTSYSSLRQTRDAARAYLRGASYTLLTQGEDDRSRLLERFKADTSSVLFATDSFWEGIDVPGESLSQVIIVKLPFRVPSEPVFAARCEAIEAKGGNPFMELSVPDGVIKFRQGFGRLLRHTSDRGAVVLLDRRVTEKAYGRIFLDSIPETRRLAAPIKEIAGKIREFL